MVLELMGNVNNKTPFLLRELAEQMETNYYNKGASSVAN